MPHTGPIIVIEDDIDDQQMFSDVLADLSMKNTLKFFNTAEGVVEYLLQSSQQPFVMFSDINLPGMTGIQLRELITNNEQLRRKSIPFIFYSTSAAAENVELAYRMMVQGYFAKPTSYAKAKETLQCIFSYWKMCLHPNNA